MEDKIAKLLDDKNIKDMFTRNIVSGFITGHTEIFGDVISADELIDRLNTNLSRIVMKDPDEMEVTVGRPSDTVGEYEGFDKNTITMYFTEEHLKNIQLRGHYIEILLHELTHCAYTIKNKDMPWRESQIFGTRTKMQDGTIAVIAGSSVYMEPIVNYISTKMFGRSNGAYITETACFEKLTTILNEKAMIKAAFNSDERAFKQCFSNMPDKAYEYYTEGMKCFNMGVRYNDRGRFIMKNFFNGKIGERYVANLNSKLNENYQNSSLTL